MLIDEKVICDPGNTFLTPQTSKVRKTKILAFYNIQSLLSNFSTLEGPQSESCQLQGSFQVQIYK